MNILLEHVSIQVLHYITCHVLLCLQSVVRTSAKAAGIWNNPPLIRNLTAGQYDKFFETVRQS